MLTTATIKKSTLIDICLRNNNFETLHGLFAKAKLPRVDSNIQHYSIKCIKGEIEAKPDDPLTFDRVPPLPVLGGKVYSLCGYQRPNCTTTLLGGKVYSLCGYDMTNCTTTILGGKVYSL